jgi:hypothetical protein
MKRGTKSRAIVSFSPVTQAPPPKIAVAVKKAELEEVTVAPLADKVIDGDSRRMGVLEMIIRCPPKLEVN